MARNRLRDDRARRPHELECAIAADQPRGGLVADTTSALAPRRRTEQMHATSARLATCARPAPA
jgi:hypothetical protein